MRSGGWQYFSDWEEEIVKLKAACLVGTHGFIEADRQDVEVELFLQIWESKPKYDPGRTPPVSVETFIERALDNRIRNLIDAKMTIKRRIDLEAASLDALFSAEEEGAPLSDFLEEGLFACRETALSEQVLLEISLERALEQLSELQRALVQLRRAGFSMTEASKRLKLPRTSLNDQLKQIQLIFQRNGMAARN